MMGWMAPLRHLSAKLLGSRPISVFRPIKSGTSCIGMSLGNSARDSQETFSVEGEGGRLSAVEAGHGGGGRAIPLLRVQLSCPSSLRALSVRRSANAVRPPPQRRRRRATARPARARTGLFDRGLVELVRAGLATATAERVVAGSKTMEVARVRITEAGGGR